MGKTTIETIINNNNSGSWSENDKQYIGVCMNEYSDLKLSNVKALIESYKKRLADINEYMDTHRLDSHELAAVSTQKSSFMSIISELEIAIQ